MTELYTKKRVQNAKNRPKVAVMNGFQVFYAGLR